MGRRFCKWYIARVQRPRLALGRNVIALGVVSFFTDVSSEMIYPLLPLFLTATLGASASALGAIEGAAETTASLLKLASGWWSDRVQRRKPLVVAGYTLAALARPLVAAAQSVGQVLAVRLTDRVGKGIRNSPRDALIADSVDPSIRGRAFGFHRAADHAGAVVGPLLAFVLLQVAGMELREVFWLALVPGAAAVVAVTLFVRDVPRPPDATPSPRDAPRAIPAESRLPRPFWAYLAVVLVFTLGNSTDAFLLLRASQLGVPTALIPILWAALHVVKSIASPPGGALADRVGRLPALAIGWGIYAAAYAGFALATAPWHAWALFLAYGLFFALAEPAERALVADFVPASRRGTAFGWFHLAVGLGMLPASVMFGLVWDAAGPRAAFLLGAALSLAACLGLALLPRMRDHAPAVAAGAQQQRVPGRE